MPQPYIIDERIGMVAVYRGPQRNCLSGITADPSCRFVRHGEWRDEAWYLDPAHVEAARVVCDSLNRQGG